MGGRQLGEPGPAAVLGRQLGPDGSQLLAVPAPGRVEVHEPGLLARQDRLIEIGRVQLHHVLLGWPLVVQVLLVVDGHAVAGGQEGCQDYHDVSIN